MNAAARVGGSDVVAGRGDLIRGGRRREVGEARASHRVGVLILPFMERGIAAAGVRSARALTHGHHSPRHRPSPLTPRAPSRPPMSSARLLDNHCLASASPGYKRRPWVASSAFCFASQRRSAATRVRVWRRHPACCSTSDRSCSVPLPRRLRRAIGHRRSGPRAVAYRARTRGRCSRWMSWGAPRGLTSSVFVSRSRRASASSTPGSGRRNPLIPSEGSRPSRTSW
jgi:hypothetical protein